jgi:hypothetical protein
MNSEALPLADSSLGGPLPPEARSYPWPPLPHASADASPQQQQQQQQQQQEPTPPQTHLGKLARAALATAAAGQQQQWPPPSPSRDQPLPASVALGVEQSVGGLRLRRVITPSGSCPLAVYVVDRLEKPQGMTIEGWKRVLLALESAGEVVGEPLRARTAADGSDTVFSAVGGGLGRSLALGDDLQDLDHSVFPTAAAAAATRAGDAPAASAATVTATTVTFSERVRAAVVGSGRDALPLLESASFYVIERAKKMIIRGSDPSSDVVFEVAVPTDEGAGATGATVAGGGGGRGGAVAARRLPTAAEITDTLGRLHGAVRGLDERSLFGVCDDGMHRDLGLHGLYLTMDGFAIDTTGVIVDMFGGAAAASVLTGPYLIAEGENPERLFCRLVYHIQKRRLPLREADLDLLRPWMVSKAQMPTSPSDGSYRKYVERLVWLAAQAQAAAEAEAATAAAAAAAAGEQATGAAAPPPPAVNNPALQWMVDLFEQLGVNNLNLPLPLKVIGTLRSISESRFNAALARARRARAPAGAMAASTATIRTSCLSATHARALLARLERLSRLSRLSSGPGQQPSHYLAGICALGHHKRVVLDDDEPSGQLFPNVAGTEAALSLHRLCGDAPGPRRGDLYVSDPDDYDDDARACHVYWRPFPTAAAAASPNPPFNLWAPPPPDRRLLLLSPHDNGAQPLRLELLQTRVAAENGIVDLERVVEDDGRRKWAVLIEAKESFTVEEDNEGTADGAEPRPRRVVWSSANMDDHLRVRIERLRAAGLDRSTIVLLTSRVPLSPLVVGAPADHIYDVLGAQVETSVGVNPLAEGGFGGLAVPATPEAYAEAAAGNDVFYSRAVAAFAASADPGDVQVARACVVQRLCVCLDVREGMSARHESGESLPMAAAAAGGASGAAAAPQRPPPRLAPAGTAASARTPFPEDAGELAKRAHELGDAGERIFVLLANSALGGEPLRWPEDEPGGEGGEEEGPAPEGGEGGPPPDPWAFNADVAAAASDVVVTPDHRLSRPLEAVRHPHENMPADVLVGRKGLAGFVQRLAPTTFVRVGSGLVLLYRAGEIAGRLRHHALAIEDLDDTTPVPLGHGSLLGQRDSLRGLLGLLATPLDATPRFDERLGWQAALHASVMATPAEAGAGLGGGGVGGGGGGAGDRWAPEWSTEAAGGAAVGPGAAAAAAGGGVAGPAAPPLRTARRWGHLLLQVALKRVATSTRDAANACLGALQEDPWASDVVGADVRGALDVLRSLGGDSGIINHSRDPLAACNALVVRLLRTVVPFSHLGLDLWQVKAVTEWTSVSRAGRAPLRQAGDRRYPPGLGGVAAMVIAYSRATHMLDGVCGEKIDGLYRDPPELRAAEEALTSELRKHALTLALLPAAPLAALGAFAMPTLPSSLPLDADVLGATLPVVRPTVPLTHARTLLVTPDVAFTGTAAPRNIVDIAPVALASPHLFDVKGAAISSMDDAVASAAALPAAASAGRAFQALGTRLRLREYDTTATARYAAAVAALQGQASGWMQVLPKGASVGLALAMARSARAQAPAQAPAQGVDPWAAAQQRNMLLVQAALRPEAIVAASAAASGSSLADVEAALRNVRLDALRQVAGTQAQAVPAPSQPVEGEFPMDWA